MKRLVEGIKRFQTEVFPAKAALFADLATGQTPRALFITCGDSRVEPTLITQANPGELFTLKNVGNIVPPYGSMVGGVSAGIEYAVEALHVKHIIICGHSDCGAMKAVLHPESVAGMPTIGEWLRQADAARRVVFDNYPGLREDEKLDVLTQENVLAQLDNLKTHPSVASGIARGTLNLYGWVYVIHSGAVIAFDAEQGRFITLDEAHIPTATPRIRGRALVPAD